MFKVVRKEDTKTTEWSGGTTTQLAIWPDNGDYAKRQFVWRVSSACVKAEESEFTSLPGVSRCLMILDGKLWLSHEGQYELELERLQQDNFDGSWRTLSRGRVTDFNLMVTEGEGRVQVVELEPSSELYVHLSPLIQEWDMVSEIFYLLNDNVSVRDDAGEETELRLGDVIMACVDSENSHGLTLYNKSTAKVEMIRAVVYHNK